MSELPWAPEVAEQNHADRQAESQVPSRARWPSAWMIFLPWKTEFCGAVNLVKRERMARTAAEQRANEAEGKLQEQHQSPRNCGKKWVRCARSGTISASASKSFFPSSTLSNCKEGYGQKPPPIT